MLIYKKNNLTKWISIIYRLTFPQLKVASIMTEQKKKNAGGVQFMQSQLNCGIEYPLEVESLSSFQMKLLSSSFTWGLLVSVSNTLKILIWHNQYCILYHDNIQENITHNCIIQRDKKKKCLKTTVHCSPASPPGLPLKLYFPFP